MSETVELRCRDGRITMKPVDDGEYSVVLNGQQWIGNESRSRLGDRFCRTLRSRATADVAGAIDGVPCSYLIMFGSSVTLYATPCVGGGVQIHFQDKNCRWFTRLELTDDECEEWIAQLQEVSSQ